MEDTRDDAGSSEKGPPTAAWWNLDFVEKFGSLSFGAQDDSLGHKESPRSSEQEGLTPQTASQILWSTGALSEPIPNGFYSVIPKHGFHINCRLSKERAIKMQEKRLKGLFDCIPTLDELHSLGPDGYRADIILVDSKKDKKLSMLKQLALALGKGMNSNPAAMIKKIAGLVSDFYKRPNPESPAKAVIEESSQILENRGVQMLGQIRNGSCRPRAILFKVLADTVGLESRLMVGLPSDGGPQFGDSYKHMSAIVVLNSVELLVDLMRYPGQLIPCSTKAIFMTHITAAGESDSAENDSCDSPLEPNSPLYGCSEKMDPESAEKDEGLQFQRRFEGFSNVSGLSLRNMMLRSNTTMDRQFSISHSEPDIATRFWGRNRRKVVADQRTASLSPEHPLFRARGRSMLSGDRKSQRDYTDGASSSRSEGTSTSEGRRMRRRSVSITPEIGDDIVRAVRAMNETLKQNRLLRSQGRDGQDLQKNDQDANLHSDVHDEIISGGMSPLYNLEHLSSPKAMSLPSSPHHIRSQSTTRSGSADYRENSAMVSTWNKVLESPMFNNKPLLPFQEWNIDFSELTVGTRVGIGFFGEVFRGVWNGTDVAIKVLLEQDLTAENMEDFCNEIAILSRLRHPNVTLFLGACTKPPRLSLITEYMEMGSLYFLIHLSGQKKKLSWKRRIKMLRDICRGLMCIHRMNIVHRDLKSANCLVNKHWTVKICDFGLSRIMTNSPMKDSSSAGTPEWMAPELIRNEPFTEKCDIFSLGVIMWEFCTLSRPWDGIPPEKVVYLVANEGSRLDIPEGPLGRIITDCWAEPQERPNCEEILSRLLECEYSLC